MADPAAPEGDPTPSASDPGATESRAFETSAEDPGAEQSSQPDLFADTASVRQFSPDQYSGKDIGTLALPVLRAINACLVDEIKSTAVFGIAYSGGLDSTVLLHACKELLGAECLQAFHVHHGLQAAADSFAEHTRSNCAEWGVRYELLKLTEQPPAGASVEAWASEQRYRAMAQAARRIESEAGGAPGATLTAHHEDDQAETVMLRLLRGTGSRGLTGIAPELLREGHRFMRPLLTVPRTAIAAYAAQHGLRWIEDPSNQSHRFTRNAVRQRLMPLMNELAPGASHRIASAAKHWREADQLMRDYLMADLASLVHVISRKPRVEVFDCAQARDLTPARVAEAVRFWISTLGHEAPSEARLSQISNLINNTESPYGEVEHGRLLLLKYRHELFAIEDGAAMLTRIDSIRCEVYATRTIDDHADLNLSPQDYSVAGQLIRTPMGRMVLHEHVEADDANTVNLPDGQIRIVNYITGAAIFRAKGQNRAGTLKDSLQQAGIPRWLRPMLPTLSVNGQLLWVAGLGASADAATPQASDTGDSGQDHEGAGGAAATEISSMQGAQFALLQNGPRPLGEAKWDSNQDAKAVREAAKEAAKAAKEAGKSAGKAASEALKVAKLESKVAMRAIKGGRGEPPIAARLGTREELQERSSKVRVDWSWGQDDAIPKLPEYLLADWFMKKSGS